jgi:hypothetical protein
MKRFVCALVLVGLVVFGWSQVSYAPRDLSLDEQEYMAYLRGDNSTNAMLASKLGRMSGAWTPSLPLRQVGRADRLVGC